MFCINSTSNYTAFSQYINYDEMWSKNTFINLWKLDKTENILPVIINCNGRSQVSSVNINHAQLTIFFHNLCSLNIWGIWIHPVQPLEIHYLFVKHVNNILRICIIFFLLSLSFSTTTSFRYRYLFSTTLAVFY